MALWSLSMIDADQCRTVCQSIYDYRTAIASAEAAREDVTRAACFRMHNQSLRCADSSSVSVDWAAVSTRKAGYPLRFLTDLGGNFFHRGDGVRSGLVLLDSP
jgi:hypothetical protein